MRLKKLRFIPKVVSEIIVLVVFLSDILSPHLPDGFIFTLKFPFVFHQESECHLLIRVQLVVICERCRRLTIININGSISSNFGGLESRVCLNGSSCAVTNP